MDMNFTSDGDRIALMMMIIAREMANMMAMAMITANLIVILRLFLEHHQEPISYLFINAITTLPNTPP